ncbi:hypothetical protein F2Q68_00019783 [Brassica cretica]|uniref:Uncharacterized protein n=3 Tax=Brassica TaxID=3705 RepID=A0A0D3E5A8_BRAOL|nr:hypothetical protein F2Q68_00019783 [Brassica cretica]
MHVHVILLLCNCRSWWGKTLAVHVVLGLLHAVIAEELMRELGDRVISVNKAEPKGGGDDVDVDHLHYRGGYPSRGKGSHGGGAALDDYRDRFEGGDKYETDDLYTVERFTPFGGIPEHHHHLEDNYDKRDRGFDRDTYTRGASDWYVSMGPLSDEGRAYRSRLGPYDRPSRA